MVKGVAELNRRLRAVPRKLTQASIPVTDRYAARVVQDMKNAAPDHEQDLINSIGIDDRTSQAKGQFIGVTVFAGDETTVVSNASGGNFQNAKLQEGGTKNMPANPFFNISVRANRRAFKSAMSRAIRKAIRSL